jgi:hypothetical protein
VKLLPLLLVFTGCSLFRPLSWQIERYEPPEPKTKRVWVDGVCQDMTATEFEPWIRDQQMRGRFVIERDIGRHDEAIETLGQCSPN